MKRLFGTGLIWLLFAVPALGTAGWILWREITEPKTISGPGLVQTDAAIGGPIALIGADGQEVTEAVFAGGPAVIYFGYTYCPDVCPTSLNTITEAMDLLGGDAGAVTPIFITVDPKRDGTEVVGDYAEAFHERMVGLTGRPEQIAAAAKAFRVVYLARDMGRSDDDYLVDHSSYYYLMDADWNLAAVMVHEITPEQMAAAIKQLL